MPRRKWFKFLPGPADLSESSSEGHVYLSWHFEPGVNYKTSQRAWSATAHARRSSSLPVRSSSMRVRAPTDIRAAGLISDLRPRQADVAATGGDGWTRDVLLRGSSNFITFCITDERRRRGVIWERTDEGRNIVKSDSAAALFAVGEGRRWRDTQSGVVVVVTYSVVAQTHHQSGSQLQTRITQTLSPPTHGFHAVPLQSSEKTTLLPVISSWIYTVYKQFY